MREKKFEGREFESEFRRANVLRTFGLFLRDFFGLLELLLPVLNLADSRRSVRARYSFLLGSLEKLIAVDLGLIL
jgi:hypothetical protein